MIDFWGGKITWGKSQSWWLIAKIGKPLKPRWNMNLSILIDRATVHRFANLGWCFARSWSFWKTLPGLGPMLRRMTLVNIYIFVQIVCPPFSSFFDIDKLSNHSGRLEIWFQQLVRRWLEADLAFRSGKWNKAVQLYLNVIGAIASEDVKRHRKLSSSIGESYLELRDFKNAEMNEMRPINSSRMGPPDQLASTVLGLARLKSGYGEHDTAWELALEALDVLSHWSGAFVLFLTSSVS